MTSLFSAIGNNLPNLGTSLTDFWQTNNLGLELIFYSPAILPKWQICLAKQISILIHYRLFDLNNIHHVLENIYQKKVIFNLTYLKRVGTFYSYLNNTPGARF